MKICPKCGKNYNDEIDYCMNCGVKLAGSVSQENEIYGPEEDEEIKILQSNKDILIDNDEEIYAELGTGYIKNIVTGGDFYSVKAVLTQKRLYLSGKTYIISKNILMELSESKIINVEDITGTGFVYFNNAMFISIAMLLIFGGFLLCGYVMTLAIIMFVASAVFFINYFLTRKSLFKIEYSGGSIGFDVKMLNRKESVKFQILLYKVKDQRKKELLKECMNEMKNT